MTDPPKSYKTAGAFRAALEARLQTRARAQGTDLQRLRRQVAFDRFLARMFSQGPRAVYPWVLKGGYAMELRMHSARTTKDIDLTLHDGTRLSKNPKERAEQVRAMLQEAAASPFDDYFEFLVGEPRQDLDGAPEGGNRYPVQARMDGRDFARFHVDVGVGEVDLRGPDGGQPVVGPAHLVARHDGAAVCGKASCVYAATRRAREHQNQGPYRHGALDPRRRTRQGQNRRGGSCHGPEACDTRGAEGT